MYVLSGIFCILATIKAAIIYISNPEILSDAFRAEDLEPLTKLIKQTQVGVESRANKTLQHMMIEMNEFEDVSEFLQRYQN